MSDTPVQVVGRGGNGAVILRVGTGYLDDDATYDLLGRSAPFAPAGMMGEAAFHSLYLTTVHYEEDEEIVVTPRVDHVALAPTTIELVGVPGTKGVRLVHEISLYQPYIVGGIERLRYAPRGTWIDVQVETQFTINGKTPARILIDGMDVEAEIVRETKEAVP